MKEWTPKTSKKKISVLWVKFCLQILYSAYICTTGESCRCEMYEGKTSFTYFIYTVLLLDKIKPTCFCGVLLSSWNLELPRKGKVGCHSILLWRASGCSYLSLVQVISCCILCSEDDSVSFSEGQYSTAIHAIPTEPSPLFLLLFFHFGELKPICRGKWPGIWRFWVSVHMPSCLFASVLSAKDHFVASCCLPSKDISGLL